jgi:3-oxoacyl-[acyl-carrier protein] reductase
MNLGIEGRVAMVAAASKGIGKAIARSLAAEGAKVSISARGKDDLEAARAEIAAAFAETCDIADAASIARWHARTVEELGPVDILVTNTGGPPAAPFEKLTKEQWRAGIDGTLMNVVRLVALTAPSMKARRWGRIVHLTSFVAKQPMPLLTISSTLRAGLSALTKVMATDLAPHGVLVNAVLPGYVATARQVELNTIRARDAGVSVEEYTAKSMRGVPLGRSARPEEIGDMVAFLCSERATYVTGGTIQVDGGLLQGTF